jgi:NAD(P)-dependent dehydrogenase (short-subunit alcohol dehydrogenase family)
MEDSLFSIKDQVAVVSGGSRGIGLALAKGFAERGAHVVITGRDGETLDAAASEISRSAQEGATVRWFICDVAKVEDIQTLVSSVKDEFGRIDTLLNVAGVNKRKRAETYTPEEYDFILDINLRGAFFLSQEVGKHMLEQGSGSQINIDSLNTASPLRGVLPYAMSKNGLSMMTRGLASEWGRQGVRVNSLAPGLILTDLTRKLWDKPEMKEWFEQNTPMERLGRPEDLVGTAVFLASPASAYMTGQILYVDGGIGAGMQWPIELD